MRDGQLREETTMRRSSVTAVAVVVAVAAACAPAAGQSIHLELVGVPGRADVPVPPVCESWHELYPNYCVVHHQDDYDDSGDGFISPCDRIVLDGETCHIDWVGPTYHLLGTPGGRDEMYLEPQDGAWSRNPVCETWHEVYPAFCTDRHVDGWEDNGDGVLSPCDVVFVGGRPWHLESVGVNIIVTPESPVQQGTWGRIKQLFGTLFGS
jgi:hypothetical protein